MAAAVVASSRWTVLTGGAAALAAFAGGLLYWKGRGSSTLAAHLLSLAQTLLVAQVGIGLMLLASAFVVKLTVGRAALPFVLPLAAVGMLMAVLLDGIPIDRVSVSIGSMPAIGG